MSTSRAIGYGFLALSLSAAAWPPAAIGGSHHSRDANVEVSTEDDDVRTCSDVRVRFGNRDAARSEDRLTGAGPRGALPLSLPTNSGAFVRGTDRRDWSIVACKAADSAATLAGVRATFDRGNLELRGPDTGDWLVYYVIEAPRGAEIDAETHNGPLRFSDMAGGRIRARAENGPLSFQSCSGTLEARTRNGPISLAAVSGNVEANAENGPISISASSGHMKVDTQNGPISVRLSGDSWRDGGLVAHAVNGPLTLQIPNGYRSGTLVESAGHSPMSCRGGACDAARRTWDDDSRRIAFGEGNPVVRLSTVNGPVSINAARED